MTKRLIVQPLGRLARILDACFVPIMYLLSGTFREAPQRTHFWNNIKLKGDEIAHLNNQGMVHCLCSKTSGRQWWWYIPTFHMPIFGGWREYVVLSPFPDDGYDWYVGWITEGVVGISRIPSCGPVRVLLGSGPVRFYGIDKIGQQVPLVQIGDGRIGSGGRFVNVPLH